MKRSIISGFICMMLLCVMQLALAQSSLTPPPQTDSSFAIVGHPSNQSVNAGQSASFNVVVSGIGSLSYQWQKKKINISGATGSSYTTPATVFADSGATFRCIVSNSQGTVTSNSAILSVHKVAPSITQQPRDTTVLDGQTAAFSVTATGSPTLAYQWQKNNVNTGGATSTSYTTPATVFADSGSTFRCIVSNSQGTVTSNGAILSVHKVAPSITQQPRDTTVLDGQTAAFSVTATGSPTLAYRWQKNNVNIGGATNASYTTPATIFADSGATFRCIVSNSQGTVTSNSAILSVHKVAPSITQQPRDTTVLEGQTAAFSVTVTGSPTLAYQWQKNSVNIGGATNASYTTPATIFADSGSTFRCIVSNSQGTVTSNNAILSVHKVAPSITQQPRDTTVLEGQTAAFAVTATGSPTLVYQWQKNSVNIGGATNASYTTPATIFADSGATFRCIVSNSQGTVTSNSAILSVHKVAPSITQQPRDTTVLEGQTAAFAVTATGSPTLAYQWQKNNVNIGGATGTSYTTPATVFADSGSTFRCIVSNSQGTVTSNGAILSVHKAAPVITQQPRDTTVLVGQTATFAVTATGSPALAFQWQKNNANIGGATNSSYTTPAAVLGDNGATFRCIVSNSVGTVTSNSATLTVLSQPAGSIISDDFHTGTLNTSLWTFVNPNTPSTLSFTGVGTTDALLSIAVPAGGSGHDVWTGGNFAPRIMQNIGNSDFQAEVKFQSSLTAGYQMQGIIVEQDANNYLRFDYLRTPTGLFAFSASISAGNATQRINVAVTGSNPAWLRVTRSGNNWTFGYSTDGITFTTAGTYAQTLTVNKIGPFAGNAVGGTSPALTCLIDYFFNTAYPVSPEDPVSPSITTQPADQSVTQGNTATFSVVATGNPAPTYQWQKNNADIGGATNASYTTPATVHADSGATFRCIVRNAAGTVTSNPAILTVLPPSGPSTIVSDDFHTGTLNAALWTYVNPLGDATLSLTGANTSDALLNIALPGGTAHDLWTNGYQVPRIMQNANNADFTVEAKFQSTFTAQFESEGIVVEHDTNNVIRFDIFYDGANTNVFASSFIGGFGTPTIHLNAAIGAGAHNPAYLRINRAGNTWTVSTSFDGTTFTPAGNFTLAFVVAKVGVWGGNSGTNPAFTMLCDYFFNNASPIDPEDPLAPAAPIITQQPANQTVSEGHTATFSVVATGSPTPAYKWQKNNADIGGATNASYTTPATVLADSGAAFRCIVSNTLGTVTSNPAILSVTPLPLSTIVSDDFHTGTLNGALWTYVNPLGDATLSLTGANTVDALLNIALPGGTAHDFWTNGFQVPRIMQNANNTDFTVEAKFQSTFTAQYESEGIVVEQDTNNVIRFDIYYDGSNTYVFASSFIGGFASPTIYLNAGIGTGAQNPAYLRINRTGNTWTVSTSFDGTTFTPAGNFTLAFTVTKVGVWGGNSGTNPAFTMLCDYFFNNASPIIPEDPVGGLVARYRFDEGKGDTIHDVSHMGAPLDLAIGNGRAITWTGSGLAVNMSTTISSGGASEKVLDALKRTKAITIEIWLRPTLLTYGRGSRIMSFGGVQGSSLEILHGLSPDRSSVDVKVSMQMTAAGKNTPPPSLNCTTNNTDLTHIVFTRDASGTATLFVNGSEAAHAIIPGSFAAWQNAQLLLGGENTWLGEYNVIAIYNYALTKSEVGQKYSSGLKAGAGRPVSLIAPTSAGSPDLIAQEIPKEFAMYQNYPNPFNPATTIKFDLPKDENVQLDVYNLLGQHVAMLVNELTPAGRHTISWNAQGFASGVYVYRIQAGNFNVTKKLVVLK